MFGVDLMDPKMLVWFTNTATLFCKWNYIGVRYDTYGYKAICVVEPYGIMGFLGRIIARKHLIVL